MPLPVLIVTVISLVVGTVTLCLSFKFESIDFARRCTRHVEGKVIGVSPIAYFEHHIPKCEYKVGGTTFQVSGPKFANSVVGSGVKCNLTTRDELPDVLRAPTLIVNRPGGNLQNFIVTNEVLYEASPISKLYPIGSKVDIWYDPDNPKVAYVQRPVDSARLPRIILRVIGTLFDIVAIVLLVLTFPDECIKYLPYLDF